MKRPPLLLAAAVLVACAGVKTSTSTGGGGSGATGSGARGGSSTTTGSGGSGPPPQSGICQNLQCRQNSCTMGNCTQTSCPNGGTTSLSGTVYDPAGKIPLYNVVVFVPNQPLLPISDGAACETCDGNFSGHPIAVALSDSAGHFQIDDVPVGDNVPLVIQVGKWRRQITIPNVPNCVNTPITDADLTRLPRNKSEGNLPRIAIATGGSDAIECLLRKVGVSDSEFTNDAGDGRVQLFGGYRAATTIMSGGTASNLKTVAQLWSTLDSMMRYDLVLMACEGDSGQSEGRSAAEYAVVRGYADMGGRIFGSHYHVNWIRSEDGEPNQGYPQVVKFASGEGPLPDGFVTTVDTSFPKGLAFRDWLVNVGASTTPGELAVVGSKHMVDATLMAQQWIYGYDTSKKTNTVQYFSFTAPVGGKECGRMVFSDVHLSGGGGTLAAIPFPSRCDMISQDLSPQEKALEFMLFDLSSCVQKDDKPVEPPPIVP